MGKSKVTWKDGDLKINLEGIEDKMQDAIKFVVDYHAAKGQAYMKQQAPWTDRTSAARNGLFTIVQQHGGTYTIVFSHTVHYGIWLEVKFSGRDAIIVPTIQHVGAELMSDLKRKFKLV